MNKVIYTIGLVTALMITGCASYRTNSDLEFDSTKVGKIDSKIRIIEGDLVDTPYTVIGPILATVKKLTLFHPSPTKQQVDAVLVHNAELMGANAIINVSYSGGVGFSTWGFMEAKGTAVIAGVDPDKKIGTVETTRGSLQYMAIAELEITSKTYDKNLWSKAFVDVDGDETKRKGRYIELRANQLYAEEGAAVPAAADKEQPAADASGAGIDISGTYVSEITSDLKNWYFKNSRERKMTLIFKQEGDRITAVNEHYDLRIIGTLKDKTITFYALPSYIAAYEISGQWTVDENGGKMDGSWEVIHHDVSGLWNLKKI